MLIEQKLGIRNPMRPAAEPGKLIMLCQGGRIAAKDRD